MDALERKVEDQHPEEDLTTSDIRCVNEEKRRMVERNRPTDPDQLPELLTREEVVTLTGYSINTISSKLSREGVNAVDRVEENRANLYSKQEVLDKIGVK